MSQHYGYAKAAPIQYVEPSTQKESLRLLGELAQRATIHPLVRNTAVKIVRGCASRQDRCELQAIYDAVKHGDPDVQPLRTGLKYIRDPRFADYFESPVDALNQCLRGACGSDCLPGDTLVLGAGYVTRPIFEVRPGDIIMGDGAWVRVTQFWEKGQQALLAFKLNNGSVLRCTSDHRVFVVPRGETGAPLDRSGAIEIHARDVRPGDFLLTADQLPCSPEALDGDLAWLLGTHVADGWTDYSQKDGRPLAFNISGKDGHRKEEQKRRAQQIAEAQGWHTKWWPRYLEIRDEQAAQWAAACGRLAPNKRFPSLSFDRGTIAALLSGVAADADVRDGCFSTTSPTLALQLRIMLRMLGRSAHIVRVDDHGGLGKNPIYRIRPRADASAYEKPRSAVRAQAKVLTISEEPPEETFDIEVEGSRFYLPETDLIVHNCDGHAGLIVALAGSLGWRMGLRAYGPKSAKGYSHVYPVAAFPKLPPFNRVVGMDTTVGSAVVGWEPPKGNVLTAWLE